MRTKEEQLAAHREANRRYRERELLKRPYKICLCCGIEKPIGEFDRKGLRRSPNCKSCRHDKNIKEHSAAVERARIYYENNRDSVIAKQQKRRKSRTASEILRSARQRAKKKGLEFDINEDDFDIPET